MNGGARRLIAGLACVLLLALWTVPAFAQSDAEHQQFLFAYKLLQRGEFDEAADEFDEYLGKFPKGEKIGDAQYYRALLYRKAGDNVKAALLLRDAPEPTLVPQHAVDLLCGMAFSDAKRYTEALAALEKIDTSKLEPSTAASTLFLKGMAYRKTDSLIAAADAFADAVKLDSPLKGRAMLTLAMVYRQQKDNDKALAVLDQCLEVERADVTPEAARLAGDLSYNAGDYERAIGYYKTVISRYQTSMHFSPSALGMLWSQYADKRYAELQKTFDSAIQAIPVQDRLVAYYLAGSAQQERGNHEQAAQLLAKVAGGEGRVPIQEKVLYKLALSRFELKQYDAMQEAIAQLRKRFPDTDLSVDLAFLQATADAESGQVQRGAARLTAFVDRGPTSPYYGQALLRRAHLYETNKQIEPAARDYEAYLASVQSPTATSLQAGFRLMELSGALGRHERVVELAKQALEVADTSLRTPEIEQEALYRIAVAHRFTGELDKALSAHNLLMRHHPLNPYAAESLFEQGLIWMTKGDAAKGVPLLLDASERDALPKPSRINALRVVAQHDADNGNNERAFELRSKMQQLSSRDQALSDSESLWMGERLIERGNAKLALGWLGGVDDEALQDRAMLLIGRAQRMLFRMDEAVQTLNEVRATSERYNLDAWLEIAQVYRDNEKYDQALNELIALQDPDRGHRIASRALFEAGKIHKIKSAKARGRSDTVDAELQAKKAREAFKKLWLLYPDGKGEDRAKWAYLHLAALQRQMGQAEDEIKTLAELVEAAPDTPFATLAKAALANRAGREERAQAYLRQCMNEMEGDAAFGRLADELLK